jgi:hypothetical protein
MAKNTPPAVPPAIAPTFVREEPALPLPDEPFWAGGVADWVITIRDVKTIVEVTVELFEDDLVAIK